jgi:hypothetical protein
MLKVSDKPLLTLLEAGGVNDMPVIMPVAAPNDALIEAIKTVRAAGYRVSKPRKPKIFKRGKDRVGPTFVAEFADDVITRMSTFTSLEKLDWDRGERLSQAAWQSRWRVWFRKQTGKVCPVDPDTLIPPVIVAARFEQDGKVLGTRP